MKGAEGRFFFAMALLMLALAVGGFAINGIAHPESLPPFYPALVFHAAGMIGWYLLFCVQAALVTRRNLALHMRLGTLSVILAAAILISAFPVNQVVYQRSGDPFIAALNFAAITNFLLLYGCALAMRRVPARHKRLMLMAGMAILPPALGRLALGLGVNPFIGLAIYVLLIIALVVHDIRTTRRIHSVTWLGAALLIFGLAGGLAMSGTAFWAALLARLWG